MYPSAFEYLRAESLPRAIELLSQYGDEARALAGGQSLIPLMKLRLSTPGVLVDLNPISGLEYVSQSDGWLALGALARHADVAGSELVRSRVPMIHDAVLLVGDAQVRNLGTVAGALAEADPGGDWGPIILALDGEVTCMGPSGQRVVSATDFFTDYYTTVLEPVELISEVRLRMPEPGSAGAYLKLERRAGDFAVVGAAVQLTLDSTGRCERVGIGLTGVAATPLKATAAEAVLIGSELETAAIDEAAQRIDEIIDPASDTRAPAEYRREMIGVYFRRALAKARERATGRIS
jgi:aerobic carbon-monoxide dehydrogenase medium subunit